MPSNYFPAQIEQLKRKAKLLARSSNVSHSKALDHVAIEDGFANWSSLMKRNRDFVPYHFERSEEAWKEALRPIKDGEVRRPQTLGQRLEPICANFVSPWHAVTFAIEYMQSLLSRPRYRLPGSSLALAEMRWWLPYVVHEVVDDAGDRIVLNRHYKPVGYVANDYVDYSQFANLHTRPGFEQIRKFSNKGAGTGYLFDGSNTPWDNRKDAVEYVGRLERLRDSLGEADSTEQLPGWTYRQNAVYEELAPWARISSWYTSHPADEKRLHSVIATLRRRIGQQLREEDLRIALLQHRRENVDILGGKASDERLESCVRRIMALVKEPS